MAQKDIDRYLAAVHAMQSGVAMEMHLRSEPTEPKHLRVGVNSAMSDMGGLAWLLIQKGVITLDEYQRAIADNMEREQHRYEKELSARTGFDVKLS